MNNYQINRTAGAVLVACAAACLLLSNAGAQQLPAPPMLSARSLFSYDHDVPLNAVVTPLESTADYHAFSVHYYSVDNAMVPAVYVLPSTLPKGRIPCVILMHGLGGNKMQLKVMWTPLVQKGYAVFAIDARLHGDRAALTPLALFGLAPYTTREMLVDTVIDLRRGIDFLQSQAAIDPNKIGYCGFSMGGILGTLLSAVDKRVQAPILCLAGGDWKLMLMTSQLPQAVQARASGGLPAAIETAIDPIDPVHWVARISPRPVLFINGDQDTIVPVACANELKADARAPKQVFMYHGGHVPEGAEMLRVFAEISGWLAQNLKP
ncbi:MAG: alpha/beta fold hydrolase [Armatimonadetes bacterium]|nr:alpha/beta fold hydrolase [Armatimonadota bacterium]MDE2207999.1 alpha/beta fold hydrolase [Armatimonadota bacterium]